MTNTCNNTCQNTCSENTCCQNTCSENTCSENTCCQNTCSENTCSENNNYDIIDYTYDNDNINIIKNQAIDLAKQNMIKIKKAKFLLSQANIHVPD